MVLGSGLPKIGAGQPADTGLPRTRTGRGIGVPLLGLDTHIRIIDELLAEVPRLNTREVTRHKAYRHTFNQP